MKATSQSCWRAIKSLLSITVTKVYNFFKQKYVIKQGLSADLQLHRKIIYRFVVETIACNWKKMYLFWTLWQKFFSKIVMILISFILDNLKSHV